MAVLSIIRLSSKTATITAIAVDEDANSSPKGHLVTRANRRIQWENDGKAGDPTFDVTFVDEDTGAPGWPFSTPAQPPLSVPPGPPVVTRLQAGRRRADWKYKVVSGAASLDPMIIIRSRGSAFNTAISLAVLGGLVAGASIASLLF
jgi:hypothetical protein